jgi:hypothetical protein
MFNVYMKSGIVYKGFLYNQNDEKLEDSRAVNREWEKTKNGRLAISEDSEVIVFFDDISKIDRVVELVPEQDLSEGDLPF